MTVCVILAVLIWTSHHQDDLLSSCLNSANLYKEGGCQDSCAAALASAAQSLTSSYTARFNLAAYQASDPCCTLDILRAGWEQKSCQIASDGTALGYTSSTPWESAPRPWIFPVHVVSATPLPSVYIANLNVHSYFPCACPTVLSGMRLSVGHACRNPIPMDSPEIIYSTESNQGLSLSHMEMSAWRK